ncbi:hypothetical protein C7H11_21290 [Escherichia coli]|nr:hypothetical protein C7H11_21290 [Escherichia coli]
MTTRERSLIQRALKTLDRHLHEPGVAFTSTRGSLAGMIKQAWCSALGVDAGRYDTLAHFPVRPAVWLERDDDTGFQQVLERADYLAKESTKAYGTGERNFGCSRG